MSLWVVRSGEEYQQELDDLKYNLVTIDWPKLNQDLSALDEKDFEKYYRETYKEDKEKTIVQHWPQVWNFVNNIKVDDLVILPLKDRTVNIGRITTPYQYRTDISNITHHIHSVEWLKKNVNRDIFIQDLLDQINRPLTIFNISRSDAENRVKAIVSMGKDPGFNEPQNGPSTWIFQANPNKFDLRSALMEFKEFPWTVTTYKNAIHIGDRVYLWESGDRAGILADATVSTEPGEILDDDTNRFYLHEEDKTKTCYGVMLNIDNILTDENRLTRSELLKDPILANLHIIKVAVGTNFDVTPEEARSLETLFMQRINKENIDINIRSKLPDEKTEIGASSGYTIDDFVRETGFDHTTVKGWIRRLLRKKQVIFQGPPGTGKTFVAQRMAKLITSGNEAFSEIVQFHPSYAYEDFMQGIRPKLINDKLTYELEDGRFINFCKRAEKVSDSPYVLIIDEINRANISRVFGELMYLLEYRDQYIPLASGEKFKIPSNVHIIGTMNTADRSIALVDHALRRRFSFIRLDPEYGILKKHLYKDSYPADALVSVLDEINKAINDSNYKVGISYFMKDERRLKANLPEIWISEIEPYLEEYFYDQPGKVDLFRWTKLIKDKLKLWVS